MTMIHIYPLHSGFKPGDKVIDRTAEYHNWPDKRGKVIEVDGSHVLIRYESGNKRWKMHINLRLDTEMKHDYLIEEEND